MIFAVCNPANSNENQICLAFQILRGFSVEEIANAFLTKTETIEKRLQRAKNLSLMIVATDVESMEFGRRLEK